MARMKRNVGDLVSGKIGPVVFYQLNGESYVRASPNRKKDSWSVEQLQHRERISKVSSFWRSVKSDETRKIWRLAAVKMNGYALFMKANMPAFGMDGSLIDPLLLKVSAGKLHLPLHLKAERLPERPSAIAVSWQNDPHLKSERMQDELMAISSADGKFSLIIPTGILRGAMNGSFELLPKPEAPTHIYLFFASRMREEYTESVCFQI